MPADLGGVLFLDVDDVLCSFLLREGLKGNH